MLIIEGPDMVGKTTLVAAIAAEAERQRWPLKSDRFGMTESHAMLDACVKRIRRRVVSDRCWVSEVAYGLTCRTPRVTVEEHEAILAMVRRVGGVLVVVRADDDVYAELVAAHHARGEAYSREHCEAVNRAYGEIASTGRLGPYAGFEVARTVTVARDGAGGLVMPTSVPGLVQELLQLYRDAQNGGRP